MELGKIMNNIVNNANKAISMDGTHEDEEGFKVCNECGERREMMWEVPALGKSSRVSRQCKCLREEHEKQRAEEERKERIREIEFMRRSGFPDSELCKYTFENDNGTQPKVMEAAKKYAEDFKDFRKDGTGLLLYGGVGTGKTYIAAAIANALVDKGISAMVTNFARIANKMQESFEGRQAYLDSLNRFELLVIDDLAAERKTEFMQEIVFNVIDARYRSGKPMIITTNLPIEELSKPQDDSEKRTFDRILERCFPIEVKGESNRRRKLVEQYEDTKSKLGLNYAKRG